MQGCGRSRVATVALLLLRGAGLSPWGLACKGWWWWCVVEAHRGTPRWVSFEMVSSVWEVLKD
jgi:hypothetical protein